MTNMTPADFLNAVDHAAGMNDRWLFLAAFCLLLLFVPLFGLVANLACMLFYLIGPSMVPGMSSKEPYVALGMVALWGVYGLVYFVRNSKRLGKPALLSTETVAVR